MSVHIVVDDENFVVGVYDDINLVYETFRDYLRRRNCSDLIEEFNELLLKEGTSALNHFGFYVITKYMNDKFDWF